MSGRVHVLAGMYCRHMDGVQNGSRLQSVITALLPGIAARYRAQWLRVEQCRDGSQRAVPASR